MGDKCTIDKIEGFRVKYNWVKQQINSEREVNAHLKNQSVQARFGQEVYDEKMYKYTAAELQNNSAAYRNLVSRCQIGDVIQFANTSGTTYHSVGVQRVYCSDGIRKVTISQHTSNDFRHLTDKIANKTTGWVVLLKTSNTVSGGNFLFTVVPKGSRGQCK